MIVNYNPIRLSTHMKDSILRNSKTTQRIYLKLSYDYNKKHSDNM